MSRAKRKRKAKNQKRQRRRLEVLRRQLFSGDVAPMPDGVVGVAYRALTTLLSNPRTTADAIQRSLTRVDRIHETVTGRVPDDDCYMACPCGALLLIVDDMPIPTDCNTCQEWQWWGLGGWRSGWLERARA